jgi:hypothetical protein
VSDTELISWSFVADKHDCIKLPSVWSQNPVLLNWLSRPNKSATVLVAVRGKSLRDGLRPPLPRPGRRYKQAMALKDGGNRSDHVEREAGSLSNV